MRPKVTWADSDDWLGTGVMFGRCPRLRAWVSGWILNKKFRGKEALGKDEVTVRHVEFKSRC